VNAVAECGQKAVASARWHSLLHTSLHRTESFN
jgi:hypothetical protein